MTLAIEKVTALSEELLADEALVTGSLAGDREAFGKLVRRYERGVRATCWSVLRDHHLACDSGQDAFVEAYRGLSGLKDRRAFGGWVMTIARRKALRASRSRRAEAALPEMRAPEPANGDGELMEAVAKLPEQERVVVMLRFFDGREVGEIAVILGRPEGTVRKQLSRAYKRMRGEIMREMKR